MADLKLGPLPKQKTVKLNIVLQEPLKQELDAYAAEHSRQYDEPVETAELIPHILETFLRTDRAWCGHRKRMRHEQLGQQRASSASDANVNGRMKASTSDKP